MTLTERVKRKALDLGFQAAGVSRATSDRPESARLAEWLDRSYHGEMVWMAQTAAKRKNPALLLPGIRAIVSLGTNYYTDDRPDDAPGHGRIARYARGKDYHRVLGERLESLAAFLKTEAPDSRSLAYVDTGAVMEKAWAQRAGLGWIGKHSNLVSGQHGSWLLLGEVLTTADLSPDAFADFCVALATWLGGESPAFLGWEANGSGGIFGRRVWRLGYRTFWATRGFGGEITSGDRKRGFGPWPTCRLQPSRSHVLAVQARTDRDRVCSTYLSAPRCHHFGEDDTWFVPGDP